MHALMRRWSWASWGGVLLLLAVLAPPPAQAGLAFVAASEHLVSSASVPATFDGVTVCLWFRTADGATRMSVWSESGTTDGLIVMRVDGISNGVRAGSESAGGVYATTTADYSLNVWQHGCAVWTTSTYRAAYLNGGNLGEDTQTRAVTFGGTLITTVGCRSTTGVFSEYFTGEIAQVCIWDEALSAAEVAALATGVPCTRIQPMSLRSHVPLGVASPEPDHAGPQSWARTNAPALSAGEPPVAARMR